VELRNLLLNEKDRDLSKKIILHPDTVRSALKDAGIELVFPAKCGQNR